jgi:hypothetical protein
MTVPATSSREIEGKGRIIRELLAARKYSIDCYQREYKWQQMQVSELYQKLVEEIWLPARILEEARA